MYAALYFCLYFICFRIFAFMAKQTGANIPRTVIIAATAAVCAFFIFIIPKSRLLIKGLHGKYISNGGVSQLVMIISGVLAGLTGPRLLLFGLKEVTVSGFASVLAAISGICIAFVFFAAFLQCVTNIRSRIFAFFLPFLDPRLVICAVLCNVAGVMYVVLSKQVYFWDNAGYWNSAAMLSELIFTDPMLFFERVTQSIFNSDYNYLPVVMPAAVMSVFGTGRLVFILSIINLYFLPYVVFMYKLSGGFSRFLTVLFATPMLFYLSIVGFLDVGGVFISSVIIYLFIYKEQDISLDFLNGCLICLLILFRRWYIFFLIAFLVCAVIYTAVLRKGKIKKLLFTLLGFGFTFGIFFEGYLMERLLGENYVNAYSAYKMSLATDTKIFLRYFGLILTIAVIAGAVIGCVLAYRKEEKGRTVECICNYAFLIAMPLVTFISFLQIQTHGQQHLLLYTPYYSLIIWRVLIDTGRGKETENKRTLLLFAALSVLCTASVFFPRRQPQSISEIKTYAVIPSFSVYPQSREDADELLKLDAYVRELKGNVAVLASSFVLNSDLLANVNASLNPLEPFVPAKNIFHIPAVDNRDGLPYGLQNADYVITALPVQTHLAPSEQEVVTVPAQMITRENPFSAAFRKVDVSFRLKDGVTVYIYMRLRPNTEDELAEVWDKITH